MRQGAEGRRLPAYSTACFSRVSSCGGVDSSRGRVDRASTRTPPGKRIPEPSDACCLLLWHAHVVRCQPVEMMPESAQRPFVCCIHARYDEPRCDLLGSWAFKSLASRFRARRCS